MQDRRQHVRYPSLLGGQAAFHRLSTGHACVVRNITSAGARIVFDHPAPMPREFDLHVPHRGEHHRTRIVWQNGADMGVEFVKRDAVEQPIDLFSRRIRELETQNS